MIYSSVHHCKKVSPAELESLLLTHPSVADVAVVGIPDEDMIELPRAFVVKKSGTTVTPNEIVQYLNGESRILRIPSCRYDSLGFVFSHSWSYEFCSQEW